MIDLEHCLQHSREAAAARLAAYAEGDRTVIAAACVRAANTHDNLIAAVAKRLEQTAPMEKSGMRMARASDSDMEMAFELAGALDALGGTWDQLMPEKIANKTADGEPEAFDIDDPDQCRRVCEYLIELSRSASLMRVVMGMAVVLDPANKLTDPDADTIERHPLFWQPDRVDETALEGWTFAQREGEFFVSAPGADPGAMTLTHDGKGTLERRLLAALVAALASRPTGP